MGMSCIKLIKNLKLFSNDKSTTRSHLILKKINDKIFFYFYAFVDWNGSQKLSKQKTSSMLEVVQNI